MSFWCHQRPSLGSFLDEFHQCFGVARTVSLVIVQKVAILYNLGLSSSHQLISNVGQLLVGVQGGQTIPVFVQTNIVPCACHLARMDSRIVGGNVLAQTKVVLSQSSVDFFTIPALVAEFEGYSNAQCGWYKLGNFVDFLHVQGQAGRKLKENRPQQIWL